MKKFLVSEARPIPWDELSKAEQDLIEETADKWIEAVAKDPGRAQRPAADKIDENRSGRVLFINGPRGAGKTSFLLTLLKHWTSTDSEIEKYRRGPCNSDLRIILPVLDFDPLPRGMSLHGWLLEPWRRRAQDEDRNENRSAPDAGDLTERFADLFDRAVIGWTQAHTEGRGVVERALAHQDNASGWLETRTKWNDFVGAMVCRSSGCTKTNCEDSHRRVFVIAIDDVDLQVEHLPQLLHAIRLFHHPNVAYILTGNYDHIVFALLLDYIHRHEHLAGKQISDDLRKQIGQHSEDLRDAFLQKALPRHARMLELQHLSFDEALKFPTEGGGNVEEALESTIRDALRSPVSGLQIVTARQAQHATDRLLTSQNELASDAENRDKKIKQAKVKQTLEFIADICGTSITDIDDRAVPRWQFMLQGRLTTQLGRILRTWEENGVTIQLAGRPQLVFHDFKQDKIRTEEQANRALVVQLVAEQKEPPVRARSLTWAPEACVLATEVRWRSKLRELEGLAVFHWPALIRPTAIDVLELHTLAEKLSEAVDGDSLANVSEEMVTRWLAESIDWFCKRHSIVHSDQKRWERAKSQWQKQTWRSEPPGSFSPAKSVERLKAIANTLKEMSKCGDDLKREIRRWVGEIIIMTAPYFGIPETVAKPIRTQFFNVKEIKPTPKELQEEHEHTVRNAIIAPRDRVARIAREPLDQKSDPDATLYDEAVKNFLEARQNSSRNDSWWKWLKAHIPKPPRKSARIPKPPRKTASKKE